EDAASRAREAASSVSGSANGFDVSKFVDSAAQAIRSATSAPSAATAPSPSPSAPSPSPSEDEGGMEGFLDSGAGDSAWSQIMGSSEKFDASHGVKAARSNPLAKAFAGVALVSLLSSLALRWRLVEPEVEEVKDAIPDFRLKGLGQLALQSGIVLTHAMPSPKVARKSDSLVSLGIPEPPIKVVRQGSALYRSNSNVSSNALSEARELVRRASRLSDGLGGLDTEVDEETKVSEMPECPSVSMEWRDISFQIGEKKILHEVTGILKPECLTGVMGPSGCGKSTLLNILSGRQRTTGAAMSFEGEMTLGGMPLTSKQMTKHVAYVMQEDALLAFETPRDCLRFSARLKLTNRVSNEQVEQVVEGLLTSLGLTECADTIVGSELIKGISGGQRKRTSVGIELITSPSVLFLDEPLNGLDSHAAFTLTESLHGLCETGVPVLFTLHQPSSEIFAFLQEVIILYRGEVAYHGAASELAAYFESIGYECPAKYNPADHVIDLTQSLGEERMKKVKADWKNSEQYEQLLEDIAEVDKAGQEMRLKLETTLKKKYQSRKSSPWMQLKMLTAREWRNTWKNKGYLTLRIGMVVFQSILYGWVFSGTASAGDDPNSAEPNCSPENYSLVECSSHYLAHYGIMLSLQICAMAVHTNAVLLSFPLQRPIFLREYAAKQYGVAPYFLSKSVIEVLLVLVAQTFSFLITYWWTGLHGNFVLLVGISWLLGVTSSSIALIFAVSTSSPEQAMQVGPLPVLIQLLFTGILVPITKIPASLRWGQYFTPIKYAMALTGCVEFSYIRTSILTCEQSASREVCAEQLPGDYLRAELLQSNNISCKEWPGNLAGLLTIGVVCRVVAVILLWRKGRHVF
ncbi:unnamed protein product, partial [Effrenium voratum]